MPLITTYADITATTATKLGGPLPDVSGELFNAFFGVDAATSANLAPAGSAWSAIGSGPTYTSTYARMEPDIAAVRTAITNTATGYTIMGVFRRVTGGTGAAARIIACNPSSIILWSIDPSTGAMSLSGAQSATSATLTVAGDLDEFRFFVGHTGSNVDTTIYNLTDDTVSVDGTDGVTSGSGANTIDLTGGAETSNTRQIDWAWCGIFEGVVDETGRNAYYAWVKGILANLRGISC